MKRRPLVIVVEAVLAVLIVASLIDSALYGGRYPVFCRFCGRRAEGFETRVANGDRWHGWRCRPCGAECRIAEKLEF
jgi:hypothetical protein